MEEKHAMQETQEKKTENQAKGQQPPEKTEEQIATERLERYKENPQSFIELNELVISVKRSPRGLMAFVSKTSSDEIMLAQAKLNRFVEKALTYAEMQAAMNAEKKPSIITKPGGFINKAKGAFGGRH